MVGKKIAKIYSSMTDVASQRTLENNHTLIVFYKNKAIRALPCSSFLPKKNDKLSEQILAKSKSNFRTNLQGFDSSQPNDASCRQEG